MSLFLRLTIEMTAAPRPRARSTVRLVSVVVPDCADRHDQRVRHVLGETERGQLACGLGDALRAVPTAAQTRSQPPRPCRRLAAVPCPTTTTRWIAPERRRSRKSSGIVSTPSRTRLRPSTTRIRPRRVLRIVLGDSDISLRRKCRWLPRSMSRVVISVLSRSSCSDRQFCAAVSETANAIRLCPL